MALLAKRYGSLGSKNSGKPSITLAVRVSIWGAHPWFSRTLSAVNTLFPQERPVKMQTMDLASPFAQHMQPLLSSPSSQPPPRTPHQLRGPDPQTVRCGLMYSGRRKMKCAFERAAGRQCQRILGTDLPPSFVPRTQKRNAHWLEMQEGQLFTNQF